MHLHPLGGAPPGGPPAARLEPLVSRHLPAALCLASLLVNGLGIAAHAGPAWLCAAAQNVIRLAAAVAMACGALAMLLSCHGAPTPPRRIGAAGLAALEATVGLGSLAVWLVAPAALRERLMPQLAKPLGAVVLALSGMAGLSLALRPGPRPRPLEAVGTPVALLIALVVVLSQAFDASAIYVQHNEIVILPLGSFCVLLNSVALVLYRPRGALIGALMGTDLGGRMARRLLLVGLPTTAALGWLRLAAERRGWLRPNESSALLAFVLLLLFFEFARLEARRLAMLDAERAQSMRDLEAAVRARDTFLSMASHELRTPLTSLAMRADGFARRLRRDPAPPEAARVTALVQQVRRGVDDLDRLVDDLHDVARIDSGKLVLERRAIDLAEIVGAACERLAPQLEAAHMPLRCELTAAFCLGDAHRLQQVFTNLITNAIRYAAGGPLDVCVALRAGEAVAEVRDHGPGVDLAAQARIFAPFERLNGAQAPGGLGLGLFIGQQIVAAHGGRLRLDSAPGRGAAFAVLLPAAPAPTEMGAGPSASI